MNTVMSETTTTAASTDRRNTVDTTGGPLATTSLGKTYMHEHIFIVNPEMQYHWPGCLGWDEEREVARAIEIFKALREETGVSTILDPTVAGLGRHLKAMARVAAGSGINVIAATGWYTFNELAFNLHFRPAEETIRILENLFVADIEVGMEGTGIRAGVLKCATDAQGVTPHVEIVLRAVARASLRTGKPITTHTDATTERGLEQQRIFREEGVDLSRVVIGHTNQSNSLDYMRKLMDAGSFIGFDRCGVAGPHAPRAVQLDNLTELIRAGYADRIVLSHDNMVFMDAMDVDQLTTLAGPEFPYHYIHRGFLPGLRERGVSEETIDRMLVGNPREYFSR
jgi:phosphotriesterase-related protein